MRFDWTDQGTPTVEAARCTGCGLCTRLCPDQMFQLENGKAQVVAGSFLGCIACGHCVAGCPTGCITVRGRGMTGDDALPLPPKDTQASADQLRTLMLTRRSIRRFTAEPVDRAALDQILEAATTAPMGIPPSDVGVLVFHGRDRVQAFSEDACAAFARLGWLLHPVTLTLMRPLLGKENHRAMRDFVRPLLQALVAERAAGRDDFTYDAPAAMLFHYGPESDGADAHIAATYAMLMAESLGLGSCMLGTTAGLSHDKQFKQKYGVPPKNKFGLGLVLGHPQEVFQRGIRRRLADVRFA
ncbi:MAG: nitroreductase family protein [Thermoguttaceae bacterium]